MSELGGEIGGGIVEDFGLFVAECDFDETVVGWISEDASLVDLAMVPFLVVVVDDVAYGLVPGVVGLDDNFALMAVSPCAAADLGHLLETAFEATEIGEVDEVVGTEDSDNADVFEIETFGDHLGSNEDVDTVLFEIAEDFEVTIFL